MLALECNSVNQGGFCVYFTETMSKKKEQQERGYIILHMGDVLFSLSETGVSRSACTNTQPSFNKLLMTVQIEIQSISVSLVKQQLHVK